jgi:CBS domain-containing protein
VLDSGRAADVMERNPVTVMPSTQIREALRLMSEQNLTGLAVLEGDKLVGIVTERDYLRVVRSMLSMSTDS